MPISTYIIDDETSARERMQYLITTFLKEEVIVIGYSNSPITALK
jgi:hypothetical protein